MANPYNPKQKEAIYEKLKNSNKLTTNAPRVQTPHPRMLAPITPPQQPGMPPVPGAVGSPNQVNQNFVGNPRQQKFMRIKKMFGL